MHWGQEMRGFKQETAFQLLTYFYNISIWRNLESHAEIPKQCPVSYSLRAQRTSLAPVCVSGIPQLTFPISPAPPRRMGSRILQHPRYDQMLEDQTQIEVIHVLRPHESQKKKSWGISLWSWTKVSGDTPLDMLIRQKQKHLDKMTESSFNHLFTFEETNNMAQISQVSMDCQLALLSSATADLAVFCSICFWKMPEFQLLPTKAWTLLSSFRWETIATPNHFLRFFVAKTEHLGTEISWWRSFTLTLKAF